MMAQMAAAIPARVGATCRASSSSAKRPTSSFFGNSRKALIARSVAGRRALCILPVPVLAHLLLV
jgi:hypothetical protein